MTPRNRSANVLQTWCALVAPHQAPGFELSHANYNRTNPACAPISSTTDSPSLSITATPLNLHKRFLTGGFLQTAVSDAPRTPPEIDLPLTTGRIRYSTSVSGPRDEVLEDTGITFGLPIPFLDLLFILNRNDVLHLKPLCPCESQSLVRRLKWHSEHGSA